LSAHIDFLSVLLFVFILLLNLLFGISFRENPESLLCHLFCDFFSINVVFGCNTIVGVLMNYINIYCFLEDPVGSRREIIKENRMKYQNSLFPEMQWAYF